MKIPKISTRLYIYLHPARKGIPGSVAAWWTVAKKACFFMFASLTSYAIFPRKTGLFMTRRHKLTSRPLYSAPRRGICGNVESTPGRAFDCFTPRPARFANRRINGAMNKEQIITALITDHFKNACDNQSPFADKVIEAIETLSTPERREILRHVTSAGAIAIPGNLSYNYSTQEWVL